jgi:ABC-2 type transport system permease protein
MREIVDGIGNGPHPEDAARQPSQRTHPAGPADFQFTHALFRGGGKSTGALFAASGPPLNPAMRNILTIFRREFASYFTTPLAYVFIVIFLVMAGLLAFFVGNFFDRGQADLQPFFAFHPWLYLVLIPALSMRLWAEERRSGTIELFLTLPIRMTEAVVGKFLAAWCFAGIALALTFPFWLTVNFLGHPDNGVIVASYIASWLMAGALLAVGAFVSAATKNQIIAFVVTAAIAFVFTAAGSPVVLGALQGWAPQWLIDASAQASFIAHFSSITRGVIAVRDVAYFVSVMVAFLFANAILVDLEKAE